MAHYAFLDENNIVTEVITGIDETQLIDGLTPEIWYENLRKQKCLRTSYNGSIRKNFAGIGYIYDEDFDVFIPPKPYSNWKINYETFTWLPPIDIPEPIDGSIFKWSQVNNEWIQVPFEKID